MVSGWIVGFDFQGLQVPSFISRRADPKNVASIILGGGPGTQLFPLTKRSATPAVSNYMVFLLLTLTMKNLILKIIESYCVCIARHSYQLKHATTNCIKALHAYSVSGPLFVLDFVLN